MKTVIIDENILKTLVNTSKGFVIFAKNHNAVDDTVIYIERCIEEATKLLEENRK